MAAGAAIAIVTVLVTATLISWRSAERARSAEAETDRSLQNLQTVYNDLDVANQAATQANHQAQAVLVQTLLEKGTNEFNEKQ